LARPDLATTGEDDGIGRRGGDGGVEAGAGRVVVAELSARLRAREQRADVIGLELERAVERRDGAARIADLERGAAAPRVDNRLARRRPRPAPRLLALCAPRLGLALLLALPTSPVHAATIIATVSQLTDRRGGESYALGRRIEPMATPGIRTFEDFRDYSL